MPTKDGTKVFRDPIYGYIEVGPEELKIINLPVFQRLRWISQLSFCDLAYPNAKHSRFSHVLGVMHLCGLYADHLTEFNLMGRHEELKRLLRLAGLLHDIGHWPFSHASEPFFAEFILKDKEGWKDAHVRWGQNVIKNHDFGIIEVIGEDSANQVAALISGQGKDSGLHPALDTVLKGKFSADRLDYLRRDAHHAGTPEYSIIDTQRIIRSVFIENNKLYHLQKGLFSLEGAILSYTYMYRALYYHRVARGASSVFLKSLCESFNKKPFQNVANNFLEPPVFNQLTDCKLLNAIVKLGGKVAEKLIQSILDRVIPKCLMDHPDLVPYRGPLTRLEEQISDYAKKRLIEDTVAERLGLRRIYIDHPKFIPYIAPGEFLDEPLIASGPEEVHKAQALSEQAPHLKYLYEISPTVTRIYMDRSETRPDNEDLMKTVFTVCNEIESQT